MKRFTLGHESAVGWHVFDGVRMRTFYANAGDENQATAFVDALNIVDVIREATESTERRADAELIAILEGMYRDAA